MGNTRNEALEEMRTALRQLFSAEDIIAELGSTKKPRDIVLRAAPLFVDELAPSLLAAVEKAATGKGVDEQLSSLAFYGLHILGAARDQRLFPLLMRLLRLPSEHLGNLLGDALTETISRVAISAYNGETAELHRVIADDSVDEYARLEMFGALAFLTFDARIAVAETKAFLMRFDEERLASAENLALCGWETAIALLGFADLTPRVEAAWRDGRTPEDISAPEYFYEDLKKAETDPGDAARFGGEHRLGYIEDLADELSWMSDP